MDTLKLKVIDSGDFIYISKNTSYYSKSLDDYFFDGVKAEKTLKEEWYKLKSIPLKIQIKSKPLHINERYELKKGYKSTELMPQVINADDYDSDEYEDIRGLYNYKYEEQDGGLEDIEFEIVSNYKRDHYEFVPNTYNSNVDILTQIEYPEEVYQDRPCTIDSEHMFKIIRDYVKRNYDPTTVKITSDYDFHFEVTKKINLAESYTKLVDTNNSWANKHRKPKWVNQMVSTKSTVILNLKDKGSSKDYGDDCSIAPSITASNRQELNNKIDTYLKELMTTINKNYCECPTCKGWGIIEEEK